MKYKITYLFQFSCNYLKLPNNIEALLPRTTSAWILMEAANLLIPPAVVNHNCSRSTEQLGLDPNDGSATCSLEFQILSFWLFHIGIKMQ